MGPLVRLDYWPMHGFADVDSYIMLVPWEGDSFRNLVEMKQFTIVVSRRGIP